MKDRFVISHDSPCVIRVGDPAIQSFEDAQVSGLKACPFYPERLDCSPPDVACVHLAGAAVARYVLQFYDEASEEALATEVEEFRRRAPLPPDKVKAYVEPQDHELQRIEDPEQVVQHVQQYARAVLDLKPGERVSRSAETRWAAAQETEPGGAGPGAPAGA